MLHLLGAAGYQKANGSLTVCLTHFFNNILFQNHMDTNTILIMLNEQATEAVSLSNVNKYNAVVLRDIIEESQSVSGAERDKWISQHSDQTVAMKDKMVASEKFLDDFSELIRKYEGSVSIPEHVRNTNKHLYESIEQLRDALVSFRGLVVAK